MRARAYIRATALLGAVAAACSACEGVLNPRASFEQIAVPDDEVRVIGTSDQIAAIRDIALAPDGTVWVLNRVDPFLIGLAEDGTVVDVWGPGGEGPEEFQRPDVIGVHPLTGELWVYERNPTRNVLVRITPRDTSWQTLALPPDSLPADRLLYPHFGQEAVSHVWLASGDGKYFFARTRAGSGEGAQQYYGFDIYALDPESGTASLVLPAADLLGDPDQKYPAGVFLLPYPLWSRCPDGSFLLYDPVVNSVHRFSAGGDELSPAPLPPERAIPIEPDLVFDLLMRTMREFVPASEQPDTAILRDEFESQWAMASMFVAPVVPEYSDLQCQADGSVWIQPFDTESPRLGLGNEWLRIRPDGTTAVVTLPETFVSIRFAEDRIWGTVADEFGVQSAAWIPYPE